MSNVSRTGKEEINNATSQTTFGKSVESQAQIEDAAAQASPDAGGEMLNIYRLEPIAAPDDPRWDNSPGTVPSSSPPERPVTPGSSPRLVSSTSWKWMRLPPRM